MIIYTKQELDEIIMLHHLYLTGDPEGVRADLGNADLGNADLEYVDLRGAYIRGANLNRAVLRNADLRYVDLRGANIRGANIRGANLDGADIDYSCWPLWCGSFNVRVDAPIAAQLAYHFCRLDCDDLEYIEARNAVVRFANTFHRVDECGELVIKDGLLVIKGE